MHCDSCGTPEGRSQFSTVQSFLTHVAQHIKDEVYISVDGPRICALCSNGKAYASFSSLKKHIYGTHRHRRDLESTLQVPTQPPAVIDTDISRPSVDDWADNFADFDVLDNPDPPEQEETPSPSNICAFSTALFEGVVDKAIELECNPSMNRVNADIAIANLIETIELVCNNVALAIGTIKSPEDAVHLASQVEQIPEQLAALKTEHKRHKYYENRQFLIKPETRVLDERPETRHNNGNGELGFKTSSIESISIKTLLSLLFGSKEFCSELLWPSDFTDPNHLRHPFSGARSRKLQRDLNDDFIAIEEYGDEFETCNPLGAKKGKHKVMGKYCRILNLGDHVSSTLMQIFLYLIGTSDDFKNYRNTTLLWTLEELKELETSGIWAYDKHGSFRRIPVVLFSSVGDNLYSNDVNGLQMSFSNGRPCRACPLKYAELVKLVSLNGIRLRSRESYDAAVNDPSSLPKDTGIHRRCAFNELQFYHCMEAIVFDPMHDLAHGHGSWFLKGVLKSIIVDNNILSLEELNALIEEFPFHGRHQSTKPGPLPPKLFVQRQAEHCTGNKRRRRVVSEEQEDDTDAEDEAIIRNGKTITQSASQMVTLLTFLPLILRSFADELQHVPEWTEFLHFQRMLDIIFSHSLEKAHVTELRILTEQHLAFCVRRWKQVLPKAHFLLHYPDAMLQMGPLRHYWCFSYESKHQTFKRYADTIFCYKNIPKSLAYKNQLSLIPFLKVIQQGTYCEMYSEFVIHQKLYLPNKKVVFSQNNTIFVGTIQSIDTCNNETHLNLCHVIPVSFDSTLHCYVYDPDDSNVNVVIPHNALVIPLPIHLYCNRYFRVMSAHA